MPLSKSFGLWSAISIVVGSIIGSGIFMKPATMAAQLGSPELLITVWIGAGIITLFGALTSAEIAAMIPETGGQYVFFQKMYGDFFAFIYGWSSFAVINTAGVASIAYVCGTYLEYFIELPRLSLEAEKGIDLYLPFIGHIFPLQNIGVKAVTILIVMLLTLVSYISTKAGGKLLVILTSLKLIAILMVVMGIFFSGMGDNSFFTHDSPAHDLKGWMLVGGIMAAMSGAFWGYDGWNNITFVAGEIKNPQKNIPASLLIGILVCIVTYVLVNLAYLYVLPIEQIAQSSLVATDAAKVVMGGIGGGLIALLVIMSTFGTTHGNILATARISYAMSAQGNFFRSMGRIHPGFGTPGNALLIHGVWASLFVLSGSFDMLTDMLIFLSFLFYGMSAIGLFVLRTRMKEVVRPYRVWGYPVIPSIFILFAAFFLVVTLINDISNYIHGRTEIINSLFGVLLATVGIPLFWYFRKQKKLGKGV